MDNNEEKENDDQIQRINLEDEAKEGGGRGGEERGWERGLDDETPQEDITYVQ